MILEARQRGEAARTIALAHTIEAIAIDSTTKDGKKLKPLGDYLKALRQQPGDDGGEAVAEFLDRKIAKQKRAAAAPPHTNPAAPAAEEEGSV